MLNYLHYIFAILEKQCNLVVKKKSWCWTLGPRSQTLLLTNCMTLARNSTSVFSSVFEKWCDEDTISTSLGWEPVNRLIIQVKHIE